MKKQTCDTCWNYSNALKRCMITQCTESPDHECEVGMHTSRGSVKVLTEGKASKDENI